MSRKKRRKQDRHCELPHVVATKQTPPTPRDADGKLLVNKLTVKEAQHLFRLEGGRMTMRELITELATELVMAALVARAIVVGNATVLHLAMPMVGEYLAYVVAIPVAQAIVRHPDLKSDAIKCLRLWLCITVLLSVAVGGHAYWNESSFVDQFRQNCDAAWTWIVTSQMHWPILLGIIASIRVVSYSVGKLIELGPPFYGAGMGCATRVIVFFFAIVLFPLAMAFSESFAPNWKPDINSPVLTWGLWTLLLIAQSIAIWIRWDIQIRLEKSGQLPN